MKKYLVLAVLSIVAAFGINSATASAAATCAAAENATQWQASGNWLYFQPYLQSCTDTDQVEIDWDICVTYGVCGADTASGWYDLSTGIGYKAGAAEADVVTCGRLGVPFTTQCITNFYKHPWCGGNTHVVFTEFIYRIHNRLTHTWGPFHYRKSGNYGIVC